jgi:hypothetical protein
MANLTRNTFTAGQPIVAADMNANFTNVQTLVNEVLDGTESHTDFTATGTATLSGPTTLSGATTLSGNTTISGVIQGASPLVFEGTTANNFETTLAVTDPTADRTVTLPDGSGTVAFLDSDITGNAATATTATTASTATKVTLTDESSDTTCFPVFSQTATGDRALETDASALTYNASNGTLSATKLAGTLTTAAQTNITSVGTLGSLAVTNAVSANNISLAAGASVGGDLSVSSGSESSPSITFTGDTDTGIFREAANKLVLVAGGNGSAVVENTAFSLDLGVGFYAWPGTGTGNDAEWVATGFGNYYLVRNSSLRAEKENIQDPGSELTASMIDDVEPLLWNRIHAPGIPEIGPIAEDMDEVSPYLAAHGFDENGDTFVTGFNKTGWMSLMTLAIKDLRERMEAVEAA